ncbi:MAG: endonuclease/exonuclease/phosphatase family protein [Anaerolineae bacterium]|nr:endonuclease/exonuclease/phosphatase family protein [Anaerolineae bacterium]
MAGQNGTADRVGEVDGARRGCWGRVDLAAAWLVGAYGVGLTAFLLLRALVGQAWIVIAVLNSFAHLLLWGALLLAVLMLIVLIIRRRGLRVLITLLPGVLVCLITYAPFFLPKAIDVSPDAPTFTLLTYNTHTESEVLPPLADVIRAADADVVALQELTDEAATYLQAELADVYSYQAVHPGTQFVGFGVLSRLPIVVDDYARTMLGYQRVQLNVSGAIVTLYNTHASHPFGAGGRFFDLAQRERVLSILLRWASRGTHPGPVLLAGDFNLTDQTVGYADITTLFTDSYREAGWRLGFTFPDLSAPNAVPGPLRPQTFPWLPLLVRLDYVFHDDGLRALEAHVWPEAGGSDHRPLFVRLAVVGE